MREAQGHMDSGRVRALPAVRGLWQSPVTLKTLDTASAQTSDPRSAALRGIVEDVQQIAGGVSRPRSSRSISRAIDNMVIQATAASQGPDIVTSTPTCCMHVAAKRFGPWTPTQDLERQGARRFRCRAQIHDVGDTSWAAVDSRAWLLWYRSDLLEKTVRNFRRPGRARKVTGAATTDQVMASPWAPPGPARCGPDRDLHSAAVGRGRRHARCKTARVYNSEAGVKCAHLPGIYHHVKSMRPNVVSMTADDVLSGVRPDRRGRRSRAATGIGGPRCCRNRREPQDRTDPGWTADKPTPARWRRRRSPSAQYRHHADGAAKFSVICRPGKIPGSARRRCPVFAPMRASARSRAGVGLSASSGSCGLEFSPVAAAARPADTRGC